jgi:hypothetical protein
MGMTKRAMSQLERDQDQPPGAAIPMLWLWLIAGAALALRAAFVLAGHKLQPVNSEMFYVSRAFATTGHLADAYGPGTGLTAHVTPIMPLLAGGIYRLFGVGQPAAEILLIAISLLFVAISVAAISAAMRTLGLARSARLAGVALAALLPLNVALETVTFRVWEGSLAAAFIGVMLWAVIKLDGQAERPSWAQLGGLAALSSLMALASPPAALGGYGCLGLLALRRRGPAGLVGAAALSVVLLVAISYPWAMRNQQVFGHPVWSRTNFGFNFALGYYDGAASPADPRAAFLARLGEVDPYTSPKAYAQMRALGGEPGYSAYWTAKTKAWIAAHPQQSLQIAARHIFEYYFPPRWQWGVYTDAGAGAALKQLIVWASTVLAFAAVGWRLLRREWRFLYVLVVLTLPALPYLLAQPVLRYRYLIASLTLFLAADFIRNAIAALGWANPRARIGPLGQKPAS